LCSGRCLATAADRKWMSFPAGASHALPVGPAAAQKYYVKGKKTDVYYIDFYLSILTEYMVLIWWRFNKYL
jgi:hypothetical protein